MALNDIGHYLLYPFGPQQYHFGANAPNRTSVDGNVALGNVADRRVGMVFRAPRTGNIRKVRFASGTINPASVSAELRVETVSATTGKPSGTLFGTNTNNSVTLAADDAFYEVTLTADAAVTIGDILWIGVKNPGSAPGGSSFFSAYQASGIGCQFPYSTNDEGTDKSANGMFMSIEYDDGVTVPVPGLIPECTSATNTTVTSATTPDTIGLRFQVPVPVRVVGWWAYLEQDGDCRVRLVTSAYHQANNTGVLASMDLDKDQHGPSGGTEYYFHFFNTAVELAISTNYRLVFEPQDASNLGLRYLNTSGLPGLDGYPGGRNFHMTEAKDPTADGSWTNYNSSTFRRPWMGLVIDQMGEVPVSTPTISRSRVQRGM